MSTPKTEPEPTPTPAPAPGADTKPAFQQMTTEQFTERLKQEREAGLKAALKELGFEKPEDAKARFAKLSELEKAQMSEAEKTAAKMKELEADAARAKAFEKTIKSALEIEEKAVPKEKKALLDLAPEEPHARFEWITKARAAGLFAGEAVPAAKANTAAGSGGPAPADVKSKSTLEMTDEEYRAHKAKVLAAGGPK